MSGNSERRKSSFSIVDDDLHQDILDAERRVEEHLGGDGGDAAVTTTIQRHLDSAVAKNEGRDGKQRVSRVSDPIITTDMVRRKSSMSIDSPRRHSQSSLADPLDDAHLDEPESPLL